MSTVIEKHRQAGRFFQAGDLTSFVREKGNGEPVVCMHGVPASSFLYRKVIDSLAREGLRGVAFDLPGLGLADRPEDFDYTWTGLGKFSTKAIDALDLDNFHLVVHDIGGPVGFEVAARKPDSVKSLTILNTLIRADEFHRPWPMEPFAHPVLGEIWLASMFKPLFRLLMYRFGLEDNSAMSTEEINAYVDLLKREDGGTAFLKIMRGFERTREKRELYVSTIQEADYPRQVIWGKQDPALPLERYGREAQEVTGVDSILELTGRHFLQEEGYDRIASEIKSLAEEAR